MDAEAGKTPKGGHGAPQSQDKQPQCQPGHGNYKHTCTLCDDEVPQLIRHPDDVVYINGNPFDVTLHAEK
jgi:hypothetical protein